MKSKRLKNVKKQLPCESDMTESELWYLHSFVRTQNLIIVVMRLIYFIALGLLLATMYFIVKEEGDHPQLLFILTILFVPGVMIVVIGRTLKTLNVQTDFFQKKQLVSGRFKVRTIRKGGHSENVYYVDDKKVTVPYMFDGIYHLHHKVVTGYIAQTIGMNPEGKKIQKINLLLSLDTALNIDKSFSDHQNRKAYLFYKYGLIPMFLLLVVLVGVYAVCAEVVFSNVPSFVYFSMLIAYVTLSVFLVFRLYNWFGVHYFSRTYEDIFTLTSEEERGLYGRKTERKSNNTKR